MYASSYSAEAETVQTLVRKLMPEAKDLPVSEDLDSKVRFLGPLGLQDLRLLTVVEVAGVLGIGRSKVYELLYRGELKSVKIGSSRRVRYSDLGDFVRYLDNAS